MSAGAFYKRTDDHTEDIAGILIPVVQKQDGWDKNLAFFIGFSGTFFDVIPFALISGT